MRLVAICLLWIGFCYAVAYRRDRHLCWAHRMGGWHMRARWYGCQVKIGHHAWYGIEDSHAYWGVGDGDDDRPECEAEKLCRLYFPPSDG